MGWQRFIALVFCLLFFAKWSSAAEKDAEADTKAERKRKQSEREENILIEHSTYDYFSENLEDDYLYYCKDPSQEIDDLESNSNSNSNSNILETAIHADKAGSKGFFKPIDIARIVSIHNYERSKTKGDNLMNMTWNDELASLAQGLTDTCDWDRENVKLKDGTEIGQNRIKFKPMSDTQPFRGVWSFLEPWTEEKQYYDIATGECAPGKDCSHYTAMVWSKSDQVGCGATICNPRSKRNFFVFFACNYSPRGNIPGMKAFHVGGLPCSRCNLKPGTRCFAGLCAKCNPMDKTPSIHPWKKCRPYMSTMKLCINAFIRVTYGPIGCRAREKYGSCKLAYQRFRSSGFKQLLGHQPQLSDFIKLLLRKY